MKKHFSIVIVLLLVVSLYAQNSRRVLEVKRPRMNGEDVKNIQTKLVNLGFTEVGEIDGYYGPKSEAAIKELKDFIGVSVDGYVNDCVYDFFDSSDSLLIGEAIKVYNQQKNKEGFVVHEESYDFYSSEVKIFKVNKSLYLLVEIENTAEAADGGSFDPFAETVDVVFKTNITAYLMNGKDFYVLQEGKLEKSDYTFYEDLINDYKKKH